MMLKTIYLIFLGLASGCMVAAGTFAFIAAIGIVPRMAKRTETQRFIRIYEDAIVLGGIWGTTAMFIRYRLPSVPLLLGGYALCTGRACNGADRGAECHPDSAAAHKADKGSAVAHSCVRAGEGVRLSGVFSGGRILCALKLLKRGGLIGYIQAGTAKL